jgi:hypothetical protein
MTNEYVLRNASYARAPLDPRARRLLGLLALIALLPWAATLTARTAVQEMDLVGYASQLLFALSVSHVGLTGFFWFDDRYRPHINSRPLFFYGIPALITIVSLGSVILEGRIGARLIHIGSIFWLTYHYAKQNWGVASLSASATKAGRLPAWLRLLYVTGSIGAALGSLSVNPAADPQLHLIWLFGAAITWGCAIVALAHSAVVAAAGTHWVNLALLVTNALFFTPIFLLDPLTGIAIIGAAHGLHYAVLMTGMSADRKQGPRVRRLLLLAACGGGLFVVYLALTRTDWWGDKAALMATLYLSIQMSHFAADADLWRLRNPLQRDAIRATFPYLFPSTKARS